MAAGGGCTVQTATTTVTITALPTATINYAGPYCSSDATAEPVTQTGTPGGNYSSTPGLVIDAVTGAITPSTSTAGTYTVTYTMAAGGGCTIQTAITIVTVTQLPAATINYAGPYCSSVASAAVTQTGTPGGVYSSTVGLIINAITGTITPSGSTAGTYTVTYTMAAGGGCTVQTTTTTVTITALPTATISYAGPYCSSDATAEPVTQTGTLGGNYSSTPGLVIDAVTGAITPSTSTAGTYTVTYTMAAGGGCTIQTATTTVTVTPLPAAAISYAGPYCSSDATLEPVTQTGTPGGVYSSAADLSINTVTGAISPIGSIAGTYTVTYTMAAGGGCTVQTAVTTVTITPLPVATINYAGPYCSSDVTAEPVLQTGTTGGTYSSAADLSINAATGSVIPSGSTVGTYTVTYTMAATGGCTVQTATTSVTINPTPALQLQAPNAVCTPSTVDITNPSVTINSTLPPNTTLNYYKDAAATIPLSSPQAIPDSGTYYIKATVSPSGCSDTKPVSVTINPQPASLTPAPLSYCQGDENIPSLTVDTDPAYVPGNTLKWYTTVTGGPAGTTAPQYPSTANGGVTPYFVTQTDANGCESNTRGELDVKVTTLPKATASASSTELYAGETDAATVDLNGSTTGSEVTYAWYQGEGFSLQIGSTNTIKDIAPPSSTDPPDTTTRYYFVATSTENTKCADTVSVLVTVIQHLVIPNIFSPNGDGINDVWDIKNIQEFSNAEVSIFNRYGQFIYKSDDGYRTPWDGKYHGLYVPVGTYFYIIKTTPDAKPIAGDISVVR